MQGAQFLCSIVLASIIYYGIIISTRAPETTMVIPNGSHHRDSQLGVTDLTPESWQVLSLNVGWQQTSHKRD